MSTRNVHCIKFGKEMPGLEKPPFPGELGKRIYDQVSQAAWSDWRENMQIKVINEYRLNMGDKNDYQKLVQQMLIFLNLENGSGVEVENADRGRKN